ncbi:MAG: thermonuclease family protein [Bdellovibrionales bacterium]|nr:thermonuclease family protein [Bdellovibrionales bacterium]
MMLLSIAAAFTAASFAEVPKSFKDLHVSIPNSCSVIEMPVIEPGGPYIKTTMCKSSNFATSSSVQAKVYRVVDGDTVHIYIGAEVYAVRMLGIDTPELHYLARAQPKWGEIAKRSLQDMLKPGDSIRVEFDKEKCDRYGRILVHVFKGSANINLQQIARGMAANYCITPNVKYCDLYADTYAKARSYRLGMHTDSCQITPYVWRKGLSNALMDKVVRNRRTGASFRPADYYKIPVEDRVFYPAKKTPQGI